MKTDGSIATGENPEPEQGRQPEVRQKLDEFYASLENNKNLVDQLRDRLTPVMRQEEEGQSKAESNPGASTPVADEIDNKTRELQVNNLALERILEKLEV